MVITNNNPFESLWADIKTEAETVLHNVEGVAQSIGAAVVNDFTALWNAGLPVALREIENQIPNLISGSEKFSNVVTTVTQSLESQFGPVALQDIYAIVQLAFRGLGVALTL